MSKVVSSKFGQRQLVELPPVNSSARTAVPKEVARDEYSYERSDVGHGQYMYHSDIPRRHDYNSGIAQTKLIDNSYSLNGARSRPYADGKSVTVKEVYRPRSDQLMHPGIRPSGPYSEFSQQILGHDQQLQGQYVSYSPFQQQYLAPAPAQQYVSQSGTQVPQTVVVQPQQAYQTVPYNGHSYGNVSQTTPAAPKQRTNVYGNNPNDKHIFYGPDGRVIPGPPSGFQMPSSMPGNESYQSDFLVEAVLEYGRVKSLTKLNNAAEFPKVPDYLLRHLEQEYGEYEKTDLRIIFKGGQFHVHGVPQLADFGQIERLPPPFEHLSEQHRYGTPPAIEMSYAYQ